VRQALLKQNVAGKRVAAICAAPLVLGGLGLLRGKKATCYPGFEQTLEGATYTGDLCTVDGNVTTGEGPAAAFPFAYSLLSQLKGQQTADQVAVGMRYVHLMEKQF
jgi:4-methyl-5(b-hydroxyethyl)-thiazole monophosphate biosynthesis